MYFNVCIIQILYLTQSFDLTFCRFHFASFKLINQSYGTIIYLGQSKCFLFRKHSSVGIRNIIVGHLRALLHIKLQVKYCMLGQKCVNRERCAIVFPICIYVLKCSVIGWSVDVCCDAYQCHFPVKCHRAGSVTLKLYFNLYSLNNPKPLERANFPLVYIQDKPLHRDLVRKNTLCRNGSHQHKCPQNVLLFRCLCKLQLNEVATFSVYIHALLIRCNSHFMYFMVRKRYMFHVERFIYFM